MNKSTSYRHLTAFEERHNCKITEEDLIDLINVLQLYLKFEEKAEIEETKETKTEDIKSIKEKKARTRKQSIENQKAKRTTRITKKKENNAEENDDVIEKIRNMKYETGHIPSAAELKAANINADKIIKKHGGWRNLKKKLKDSSEEENILNLMQKLNKIPTREDLKENNIAIENLMIQYGSWRAIKEKLNLAEKYEEMLRKDLEELKKSEKLTMENCKAKNIDVSFLIRKYGGWKQVLKQLQTA